MPPSKKDLFTRSVDVVLGVNCEQRVTATTAGDVADRFVETFGGESCAVDPRRHIEVYRLERLAQNATLRDKEALVVRVHNSPLDCNAIERLMLESSSNNSAGHTNGSATAISEKVQKHSEAVAAAEATALRHEISSLKKRLTQSEVVRAETQATINQLRKEFMALVEELVPRHNGPQQSASLPAQPPLQQPQQPPALGRPAVPRLGLAGLSSG